MSALEGVTLRESAPTETAPVATLTEHMGATSSTCIGTGGLMADIPLPTVTDVSGTTTESVVTPTESVSKEAKEATSSEPANPTVEPPSGEAEAETSSAKPQAKAKSVSTRKPRASKETSEEEAPEQKEEREKAEKMAEELVRQEDEEKKRQAAKDAKSKKAAAENTEKAREAAAQQRKAKEQSAEGEQTVAQKRRIKAAIPENEPGDKPPPDDDDQPWEIYHYRPHIEVNATLQYESETTGVKQHDLESGYNLDVRGTRKPLASGEITRIHQSVQFVQQEKRRVREIQAEQIERLVPMCCQRWFLVDEDLNTLSQEWPPHARNISRHDVAEIYPKGNISSSNIRFEHGLREAQSKAIFPYPPCNTHSRVGHWIRNERK